MGVEAELLIAVPTKWAVLGENCFYCQAPSFTECGLKDIHISAQKYILFFKTYGKVGTDIKPVNAAVVQNRL